jgi:tetratricopeptide (TPR) repeat protein
MNPLLSAERQQYLEQVLGTYLEAIDQGVPIDRHDLLSRHPDLAAELARFFGEEDKFDRLAAPLRPIAQAARIDTSDTAVAAATLSETTGPRPGTLPRLFGDYELLEELATGGMGIVFKARQRTPNRLVALKMILAGPWATKADIQRFRNEAETAAHLDHPHIVPIYEVGERDGHLYFSMKLFEGGTLAQWVNRKPTAAKDKNAAQRIGQLMATVARAVHYAHQRGVLHRDLKPSNILLEERVGDADHPVPHVTDFGLAKHIAADSRLTQSGILVGTPSYMAPEQAGAFGGVVTTATDVYGLGAILYALLAGQPPFAGDTVLDTLAKVRTHEPLPPRRFRLTVPRDLETICLKCLAKEPAQRYASAAHLADDLGRFLEGKPILARPTGPLARLTKWAKRQPALAGLIAVSAAAIATVIVVSVIYQNELRQALGQARAAGDEAERQKEQATANYRQARDAVQKMLAQAGDRRRADIRKLQELRRAQQEEALAFFLKIAEQQGDEPEVLSDIAEARVQAGKLQLELGRLQAARDNLDRACELLAKLADQSPDVPDFRARLAEALIALAGWHGNDAEGAMHVRRALSLYDDLCHEAPDDERYETGRAVCHHDLGHAAWNQGNLAEAENQWRQALAIRQEVRREHPERREHVVALAQTQLNLSVLYQQAPKSNPAEARAFHDQAEAGLEQLLREDPNDFGTACSLAVLRVNWAYVLRDAGKSDAALADLDKNLNLLRPMLQREPNHAVIRDRLYRTYGGRATILDGLGRYAEAAAAYEHVVALASPQDKEGCRLDLAHLRCQAGQYAQAVKEADLWMAESIDKTPWHTLFKIAQVYAQAIPAAEKDKNLDSATRLSLTEKYASSALRLLRRARMTAGEETWNKEVSEKSLTENFQPLSDREDFRRWMKAKPSTEGH